MDLRALRYFVAVLEAGSLSRAATALHVAQPALTAQIKKLEGDLGVELFNRSHAGVTPTTIGLQLYEDATRLLSDVDAMRHRIQHLPAGPEGTVTLALPSLLTALVSGPLLTRIEREYPRIRIFVLDELSLIVKQMMLDGRADIGIVVDTLTAKGLDCWVLAREPIYFYGRDLDGRVRRKVHVPRGDKHRGPGGRQRPGISEIGFADAAGFPLLLQSRQFAVRLTVEKAALASDLKLNVAHEHNSARVLRSLSLAGAGFGFLPACGLYRLQPQTDDWVFARVVRPTLYRTYALATSATKKRSAAVDAVCRLLIEELHRPIAQGLWDANWLVGARR